MLKLTPIIEPEMVDYYNAGRFDGEVFGHIAVTPGGTAGTLLYRIDGTLTEILSIDTDDLEIAEGLLRATIFKTLALGALTFSDKSIIIWGEGFSLEKNREYNIEEFFSQGCSRGCKNCVNTCKRTN